MILSLKCGSMLGFVVKISQERVVVGEIICVIFHKLKKLSKKVLTNRNEYDIIIKRSREEHECESFSKRE